MTTTQNAAVEPEGPPARLFRLDMPTLPYWIELPSGPRLKVLPLDTTTLAAARSRTVRRLRELARSLEPDEEAAASADDLLQDPDRFLGHVRFLEAQALAEIAVVDWDQVGDVEGKPLPFDPELIPALMRHSKIVDEFLEAYSALPSAAH